MFHPADKEIYNIYLQVMNDPQYRQVAQQYNDALDTLQAESESFSDAQWTAFRSYQGAFLKLYQTMMRIALQKQK